MNGVLTVTSPASCCFHFLPKSHQFSSSSVPFVSFSSNLVAARGSREFLFYSLKLKCTGSWSENVSRFNFRCNSSTNPGEPSGQALAEAHNERVESTVGEFLSMVGGCRLSSRSKFKSFRNELRTGEKSKEWPALCTNLKNLALKYWMATKHRASKLSQPRVVNFWVPPPVGSIKINFDAAIRQSGGVVVCVGRNHDWEILIAPANAFVAEAIAIVQAMKIAAEQGWDSAIVEEDA